MFTPLALLAFCWTLAVGLKHGPAIAVAQGWMPSAILIPVWLTTGFGSLSFDLRTAASLAVLISMLAKPDTWTWKWCFADALAIGLVIAVSFSQHFASGLRPLTVPEIIRMWFLPYLMGRILLGSSEQIDGVMRGVVKTILALSALAIFECFSKINPINTILGRTYGLLEAGEGYRWGLKRAHVTFDHPIFFGMGLVLLMPWTIEAARRARAGIAPKWWKYLPLVMAAALFATVSRGPQIAGISTGLIYAFFRIKAIRIPAAIFTVAFGVIAVGAKDQIVDLLAVVAGEKNDVDEIRIISIDGEEVEYTGTNHRVLLFKVYTEPMEKAGPFGFGSELKGIELEEAISQRFSSIDCHYLLFYLQYGYLGLGAFIVLSVGVILQLIVLAFQRQKGLSGLAAGFAGALLGVSVLLMSVWFSPDFGGIWLFSAGIAARLPQLKEMAGAASIPASSRTADPSSSSASMDSSTIVIPNSGFMRFLTPLRPHAKTPRF